MSSATTTAGIPSNTNENKNITYNDVASKLIKDKLYLTALELHTELVETGRELSVLRDFFSNPANFETHAQDDRQMSRSQSQATLDSLDLTRYSEDGAGTDERVAVLEFELRKAKETISALRNNLTMATESQSSTPDKGSLKNIYVGNIKPHEQRALNFLINEYLLVHGFKLTSITFADENQKQDFDDWDDVGLNIAKPPALLALYREGLKQSGQNCSSVSVQANLEYKTKNEEISKLLEEITKLKSKLEQMESDNLDMKSVNANLCKENDLLSSQVNIEESINKNAAPTSKDSLGSESPSEKFEIIEKNMTFFNKKRGSINTLEDNISNNSFNVSDWTNLTINTNESIQNEAEFENINKKDTVVKDINCKLFNVNISEEPFKREVFSLCYVNIPQKVDNEILDDILNHSISNENLVHTLSLSLLRIIPNIILNKREEAIPLLISSVLLNSSSSERDKLLQQLFNLKKKPSDTERMMILTGIVGIARFSEETLVENEILPQCWEQLTHKHVERRLLVAEACTALIPYVSSSIRNSLILSMLQQMLDDREEIVRESVIRALALVMSLCDDTNKYNQCEELVLNTLNDSSSNIVNLSIQVLFPVVGRWALLIGRLKTTLLKYLLHRLNELLKDPEALTKSSKKILNIINVLGILQPFLLISVAYQEDIISKIKEDMTMGLRPEFDKVCSNLTNPLKFYKSETNIGMILYEFDKYIENTPNVAWPELDWILDMMIPDLLNNLNHIESTRPHILNAFINLFSRVCVVFGKSFTKFKIRPILQTQVDSLEQILSTFSQFCPSLNVIPVYLISVLSYYDDKEELSNVLRKFLCALPLCGTPLDCLEITVKGLCEAQLQEIVVGSLWEGVVHPRPLVRAAVTNLFSTVVKSCSNNVNLLNLKVTPALVTLANDSDILVRTAAIPALGTLISNCNVKEIHDKAYMQIQSYVSDSNLKENHMLLRQLIVTLGYIFNSCSAQFRQEVIIPQLNILSLYMTQMTSQTRKIDLALALIDAFTNVVYSPVSKQGVGSVVMQGLRCLENVVSENQSLLPHKETVLSMIRECDNQVDGATAESPTDRSNKFNTNINQGVEDMRQRVSKIFNKPPSSKPNTLPNLQGIFKKK